MAQTVKNLPAMQETQVLSLGWENPMEEGMAIHSSIGQRLEQLGDKTNRPPTSVGLLLPRATGEGGPV